MEEKTFRIILTTIVAVLLVLTVVHVIYVIKAYENASIIRFIGEELW